jgi:hypothetical protein
MSEIGDAWRDLRSLKQQQKEEQLIAETLLLQEICAARGLQVRALTRYQLRVNGILDVYPSTRKFSDIRVGEWGRYESLRLLLAAHFGGGRIV